MKEKKTKICKGCRVTFEIKNGADRDFCSAYCRRYLKKFVICEFCNKEFKANRKDQRFCSDFCRNSHYNGYTNKLICSTCGQEKDRVDFIKKNECIKCFAIKNPKYVQRKKEAIPHFIEIESFLKKIDSQKYRATDVDVLMIVHLHAEIDHVSSKLTIDDMFNDLVLWYINKKREMFN
jgi:hypothetical protein